MRSNSYKIIESSYLQENSDKSVKRQKRTRLNFLSAFLLCSFISHKEKKTKFIDLESKKKTTAY